MLKRLLVIGLICSVFVPLNALAQVSDNQNNPQAGNTVTTLDEARKASIVANCQKSRVALNRVEQVATTAIEERNSLYTNIQQELQAIKLRMFRQGADASETDLLTGKVKQSLEDFSAKATDYQKALTEVASIDCQQQPELFQANLIVMRLKRALLLESSLQLKTVFENSEKDVFGQLKRRLVL